MALMALMGSSDDARMQVAVLGPYDFFGEDGLPGGTHEFTAVAAADCTIGWLRPADMQLLERAGLTLLFRCELG